jgi:tRNA A37 methylthiotransferase MiaB
MAMKKVHIDTVGCIEALCDENKYREFLRREGWMPVEDPGDADLILFNTCGLSPDKCLAHIRRYQEVKRNGTELIVCGCFPVMSEESLANVFQGRSFGPRQSEKLAEFLDSPRSVEPLAANLFPSGVFDRRQPRFVVKTLARFGEFLGRLDRRFHTSLCEYFHHVGVFWYTGQMFYIKATTGCMGKCAYCSIRVARGSVRSLPPDTVMEQFRKGLAMGMREFVLSGEDVGCYGQDLGTDLPALLGRMLGEPGEYAIHVRYIDPHFLIRYFDEFRPLFATGRIPHFCTAVQSGSNRILGLMRKEYEIEPFIEAVRYINERYPWMLLRTHVIVGFPGETEDDFLCTCDLFDHVWFNRVTVNRYRIDPINAASGMEGQIPEEVKFRRARRLRRRITLQKVSMSLKYLTGVPRRPRETAGKA